MSLRKVKIEGVGDVILQRLEEAGITELEDLVAADPAELSKLLGITVYKAKKMISSAREILIESEVLVETAEEVEKYLKDKIQRISTGSKALDKLLRGGVPTRAITTFAGPHATGKSQICFQLAANVVDRGDYVGVVETEPSTFIPERIKQICESRGLKYDPKKFLVIRAEKVTSPEKQLLAYEAIWRRAKRENLPLRLLIVDSFSARIRAAFVGREMLSARNQETARHIGLLEIIAGERNCAVVLTAQVMGIPDIGAQLEARARYGAPLKPYGGEYFLHSSTYIVFLQQRAKELWEATLVDAPDLPRESVEFLITSRGIEDVSKKEEKPKR
jgi:DNA repair protein RadA